MNGIIHMCSHPDDYDPHFRISEEKIFSDIFHYVEVIICAAIFILRLMYFGLKLGSISHDQA